MKVVKEHDPDECAVCREHGDWTTTPDTEAWLEAHRKIVGVNIRIEGTRVVEEREP